MQRQVPSNIINTIINTFTGIKLNTEDYRDCIGKVTQASYQYDNNNNVVATFKSGVTSLQTVKDFFNNRSFYTVTDNTLTISTLGIAALTNPKSTTAKLQKIIPPADSKTKPRQIIGLPSFAMPDFKNKETAIAEKIKINNLKELKDQPSLPAPIKQAIDNVLAIVNQDQSYRLPVTLQKVNEHYSQIGKQLIAQVKDLQVRQAFLNLLKDNSAAATPRMSR